ncbi:hypothetical protein [Bacillus velezensis]|uniref:hypothetical protein n=1 Tax=Bacillus velezensis TaxID=492670 RepID=UPI0034E49A39
MEAAAKKLRRRVNHAAGYESGAPAPAGCHGHSASGRLRKRLSDLQKENGSFKQALEKIAALKHLD